MTTTAPAETETFVSSQPKPEVGKWKSFMTFLYNSKEGTVLGRTGKSWLQIFVFYVIFYGVLAAFFAVLLVLFLQTLDPNAPKWQQADGIIGNVPGIGFRPSPAEMGSTLIWVKTGAASDKNVDGLVASINQTLWSYRPGNPDTEHLADCPQGPPSTDPAHKKVCKFNLANLGPCSLENGYGYKTGQPCVLLKLNRIFGWVPQPYDEIPSNITEIRPDLKQPLSKDVIYVTCNGEDAVDREHIGPLKYYPDGFGMQYFPYTNAPGYLSPVVMVQFVNPSPGVIINIECKAWAKNIRHSRVDRLGQTHFEIKVDR